MAGGIMSRIIPRDKPKSWVIMLVSCLKGFFLALPLILAGHYLNHEIMFGTGSLLFALCWLVFAVMWIVYIMGQASGKYCHLEERDWCDQVW